MILGSVLFVVGLVGGFAAGYLLGFFQLKSERAHSSELLHAANEQLESAKQSAKEQLESAKQSGKEQLDLATDNFREQLNREREQAENMRKQSENLWNQRLDAMRQEMQKNSAEQLVERQRALQENNRSQMGELLKPIKEQFEAFRKSVEESNKQNALNRDNITSTFDATMKLFQKEQEQAVKSLKEETTRIGTDAANLTKALKGENKTQGDWGEMVLDTMLENSGLTKDREYFVQNSVRDDEGKLLRPDVVVRFPEGRSVVIDSKVSLTNYANAVAATDDAERERQLKEHVNSLRKHVDELAAKDYSKVVPDAIGFVLLFVPNESGYIAAMRLQEDLCRYAYEKHIIIISPSNLMMALQLAYNLWQYDRQNKNVEKIVKGAADLYDKVAGFADDFDDLEKRIANLSSKFKDTKDRLYYGKGNIMRRVETLKAMGVTPKKQIKGLADGVEEEPGNSALLNAVEKREQEL